MKYCSHFILYGSKNHVQRAFVQEMWAPQLKCQFSAVTDKRHTTTQCVKKNPLERKLVTM